MPLFRSRFRVESTRVRGWDYSAPAFYFVTICTRNRACNLGDIVDGALVPSVAGQIVTEEWLTTPEVRPNVGLDAWIVMPNHLHGIVVINELPPIVETTRRFVLSPE
jgi:putative transposase